MLGPPAENFFAQPGMNGGAVSLHVCQSLARDHGDLFRLQALDVIEFENFAFRPWPVPHEFVTVLGRGCAKLLRKSLNLCSFCFLPFKGSGGLQVGTNIIRGVPEGVRHWREDQYQN
jgi:hypothetical protein